MQGKSVPIVLKDGKTRQLRFEWQQICRLEKEKGISLFDAAKEIVFEGKISPIKITAIIWAGLIHEDEKLTIEQVEEFMEFSKISEYINVLSDAIDKALPEGDKSKEKKA